jgi:predicted transcriptional regulator
MAAAPLRPANAACTAIARGYTSGMKTAISLPDVLFHAAERQARRSRKSRSQLYADALAEYLDRHAPDEVTEAMNRVVDQLATQADPFVSVAARSAIERVEW